MSIMDFYLYDLEGFTMRPPSVEEGHTKRCLASAMRCAVENARDNEYFTDHEFALWAQEGGALRDAYMYLNEDVVGCQCPPRYEEDRNYFVVTTYSKHDGKRTDEHLFCTLTDAAAIASEAIDLDVASAATVGYYYDSSRAVPYVWMSLNYAEVMGM